MADLQKDSDDVPKVRRLILLNSSLVTDLCNVLKRDGEFMTFADSLFASLDANIRCIENSSDNFLRRFAEVYFLSGGNDLAKGSDVNTILEKFRNLMDLIKESNMTVHISEILPRRDAGYMAKLPELNGRIAEMCAEHGVSYKRLDPVFYTDSGSSINPLVLHDDMDILRPKAKEELLKSWGLGDFIRHDDTSWSDEDETRHYQHDDYWPSDDEEDPEDTWPVSPRHSNHHSNHHNNHGYWASDPPDTSGPSLNWAGEDNNSHTKPVTKLSDSDFCCHTIKIKVPRRTTGEKVIISFPVEHRGEIESVMPRAPDSALPGEPRKGVWLVTFKTDTVYEHYRKHGLMWKKNKRIKCYDFKEKIDELYDI